MTFLPNSEQDKIKFQGAQFTPDGAGGKSITWADGSTVWANIDNMGGSERLQAGQTINETTFRVTCRSTSEIAGQNAGDRLIILENDAILHIEKIDISKRVKHSTEFTCRQLPFEPLT